MLAQLKKAVYSGKKDSGSPWRVDFRDIGSLPDTKPVRTGFLVSLVLFTALGSLMLFIAHREFTLSGLQEEKRLIREQLDEIGALNNKAEANYKLFLAEEKKIADMRSWATSPFSFPDYLVKLASLMPSGVKASKIEYRGFPQTVLVVGSVDGQDVMASKTASAFIANLQQDENFKNLFSSVTNSNFGRNAATGTLSFELIFTFAAPPAAGTKK
jgi:hypothetical protein